MIALGIASVCGGSLGAILLLVLPASAFKAIVPFFIAVALVLDLAAEADQQLSATTAAAPREGTGRELCGRLLHRDLRRLLRRGPGDPDALAVRLTIDDKLQRLNAVKVVTTGLTNLVAGVVFVIAADVAWYVAALIAGGSIIGGALGARFGRRLSPQAPSKS